MEGTEVRGVLKLVPFIALIVVGVVLLILASFTLLVCDISGCHRVFAAELGIPGIFAIIVGVAGLFFVRIAK